MTKKASAVTLVTFEFNPTSCVTTRYHHQLVYDTSIDELNYEEVVFRLGKEVNLVVQARRIAAQVIEQNETLQANVVKDLEHALLMEQELFQLYRDIPNWSSSITRGHGIIELSNSKLTFKRVKPIIQEKGN